MHDVIGVRQETADMIRAAAKREAARAPRFVPGSPQWNRLAAIWASAPSPTRQAQPAA